MHAHDRQVKVPHQRGRKLFWPRADAIRAARLRLERGKPLVSRESSRLGAVRVAEFFGLVTAMAPAPNMTSAQIAAAKAWGSRRTKYGEKGYANKPGAPGNQHAKRTHCMRGHKYRPGSFWVVGTSRRCKACQLINKGRARLAKIERAKRAAAFAHAREQMKRFGIKNHQDPQSSYWRDRYLAARERFQQLKKELKRTA